MTNKEILQKAIDKAIDGGWEQEQPTFSGRPEWPNIHIRADDYSPKDIIFNHEFAKALWGDELCYVALPGQSGEKRKEVQIPKWQAQLQQMVIAENPLKYLGDNL